MRPVQIANPQITKIKVHYKGLSKRYDEVIERGDFEQRLASVQLKYAKTDKKGPAIPGSGQPMKQIPKRQ